MKPILFLLSLRPADELAQNLISSAVWKRKTSIQFITLNVVFNNSHYSNIYAKAFSNSLHEILICRVADHVKITIHFWIYVKYCCCCWFFVVVVVGFCLFVIVVVDLLLLFVLFLFVGFCFGLSFPGRSGCSELTA